MTKRTVILQALSSTPADIVRLTGSLEKRSAGETSESVLQSARGILLELIEADNECRHVILEQFNEGRRVSTGNIEHPSDTASVKELSETFRLVRGEVLTLLQALKPEEWQRLVQRPGQVKSTIRSFAQSLVEHDIGQTSRLVQLIQGGAQAPNCDLEV